MGCGSRSSGVNREMDNVSLAYNDPPGTGDVDECDGGASSSEELADTNPKVETGCNSKSDLVAMNASPLPALQKAYDHEKSMRFADLMTSIVRDTTSSGLSSCLSERNDPPKGFRCFFCHLDPLLIEAQALPGIGASAFEQPHCHDPAPFGAWTCKLRVAFAPSGSRGRNSHTSTWWCPMRAFVLSMRQDRLNWIRWRLRPGERRLR